MPKWINTLILVLVVLSFLPLSIVYVTRAQRSKDTRLSIIPDMDDQQKFKSQTVNVMFADKRAMRPQIDGTIARGGLREDAHFFTGLVDGEPVATFPLFIPGDNGEEPLVIDEAFMQLGQQQYNIYCTMCHGYGGFGDGLVATHMDGLVSDPRATNFQNTWVPPSNLHDQTVRDRPVGHLYNSITNGIRNMPPYGSQIEPLDRWAIVAYVRALQHSQTAGIEDVPPMYRGNLELRRPAPVAEEADEAVDPDAAPAAEETADEGESQPQSATAVAEGAGE